MADKIRLAIIGANIHRGWAPRSHLPAIVASPEFELTAVCTTRMESAEESRDEFGARLAFDDYHKMLAHPDIDAVAVSLRVPNHYEPTLDALNAGKHVYTEWPLGQTTAEAREMADLAVAKGLRNMVGLQSRANPAILYAKELVESGYVGEVMSCHVSRIAEGGLQRLSDRTWQRDKELGANTLTISCGHTIDALRFVVGDFSHVSSVVSTTEQLPLHRRHKTRAGGVATPKDTRHSTHGPGSQKGGGEQQTAGKTTAGQRARPVHQMPARTRQAKQGPL